MNVKKSNLFGVLLVFAGIIMGIILANGFGVTDRVKADSPDKAQVEGSQNSVTADANLNVANALSNAFADVAAKVNPAVVMISTETTVRQRLPQIPFPFQEFFGVPRGEGNRGDGNNEREFKSQGLGSGVIVREDGVILTNNHVVHGADEIIVTLMDGRELKGKVKGTDPRSDLAVVLIDADNLPTVSLGNSDNLRVGDWVLAIGSPLSPEYNHTVTAGIVSATGRRVSGLNTGVQDFIQTDAAINPGNSGGALVNLSGELIGINTAIASRTGQNSGIGFAISSNLAKDVMQDILKNGKVSRGYLGVDIGPLSDEIAKMADLPNNDGVLIRAVRPNTAAEKAGVEPGDIVLKVNGKKVRTPAELSSLIGAKDPGDEVKMLINRDGKEKTIKVRLGEFPDQIAAVEGGRESRNIEDLGLEVQNLNSNLRDRYGFSSKDKGVVVSAVQQNSLAARAGLKTGDLILKVNRTYVGNVQDFNAAIEKLEPGDAVLLQIKRDNRKMIVDFEMPKN